LNIMSDDIPTLDEETIRSLIYDCVNSNNIEIIVQIVVHLKKDYQDLAKLATMGYYDGGQTHQEVLDYVTYEA